MKYYTDTHCPPTIVDNYWMDAVKLGTDIQGPQMINCNNVGNSLNLNLYNTLD